MKYELPKKKLGKNFIIASVIAFPLVSSFYIVSINSNNLINSTMSFILLLLSAFFLVLLGFGIYFYKTGTDKITKRLKKGFRIALIILAAIYNLAGYTVVGLLYAPGSKFKDWLITTAMTTMSHQYFATWFYDDDVINSVLDKNKVVDDPSKVKLGISKGIGQQLNSSYGQFITQISNRYDAIIATNASGFYDPDWNSTGGVPHGIVISDGKLIANNSKATSAGGLIGFTSDNKLVLARMTANEAIRKGIRDAVDFGPFLIVNGKSSFINGNGGWGQAPRTAIGQREDGIVLLLVIDGRQTGSIGADMNDLTRVMLDYGAINAANLDGGTSSAMSLNGKIISNPRNGNFQAKTRPVPNAWIVVK